MKMTATIAFIKITRLKASIVELENGRSTTCDFEHLIRHKKIKIKELDQWFVKVARNRELMNLRAAQNK